MIYVAAKSQEDADEYMQYNAIPKERYQVVFEPLDLKGLRDVAVIVDPNYNFYRNTPDPRALRYNFSYAMDIAICNARRN